ncbi:uncharacterized protein PAC_04531 [Phialocephala subalpina]|uniref:Uncharacterized protein n=1 Tax=Phialocephala subalpina TaxID=576137 RepID=A0A1L7WPF0_9HELO|nr:uncharacterized protein PAC_04531 [Phialocephala subalpina]
MASTANTRNSANANSTPFDPTTDLPAAALLPYNSVWGEIDSFMKSKCHADALRLSDSDPEAFEDIKSRLTDENGELIGNTIRSLLSMPMTRYMTQDLQNCWIEKSVWSKIGIHRQFPGRVDTLDVFTAWYSEVRKPVLQGDSSKEENGKDVARKELEDKGSEKKEAGIAEPDYGHQYEERYADGEDDDTDGGVRLYWT